MNKIEPFFPLHPPPSVGQCAHTRTTLDQAGGGHYTRTGNIQEAERFSATNNLTFPFFCPS